MFSHVTRIPTFRHPSHTTIQHDTCKNLDKWSRQMVIWNLLAIITAETETKLANLGGQREIDLAAQERSNAISSIKATAEAFKLRTETEAKNNAAILEAETKAMGM